MPAKVITVAIEKGGTGKTVTASNLAYLMGEDGKKVLCIDTDPQGNLTSALSDGKGEITEGLYEGHALYVQWLPVYENPRFHCPDRVW